MEKVMIVKCVDGIFTGIETKELSTKELNSFTFINKVIGSESIDIISRDKYSIIVDESFLDNKFINEYDINEGTEVIGGSFIIAGTSKKGLVRGFKSYPNLIDNKIIIKG